jgi:UPF0755 protein
MKSKKIFLTFIISTLSIIFIAFLSAFIFVKTQIKPVSSLQEETPVQFEISYGESTKKIATNLQNKNLIKNADLFYYFVRYPKLFDIFEKSDLQKENFVLKSGTYYLSSNMSYSQIIKELSSGQQEFIKIAIPEGHTVSKIARLLEQNQICKAQDFINICIDQNFLQENNISSLSAEGYLFPDTYFLNKNMDSKVVAQLMIKNFFKQISTIPQMQNKTPEELDQIVILASIVEKEYRLANEAPLIASVFKNRLRRNIGLYSCATLVYIITEINGEPHPDRILIEDTKIDNPYNTYKWAGLTPGAISNPGLIALKAAANPPKTNYYFFQVVDVEEGRHVFTSTFEEHKSNHTNYINK